jgi:dolichyl-phosphate-mannose-protein mannosyltransferase
MTSGVLTDTDQSRQDVADPPAAAADAGKALVPDIVRRRLARPALPRLDFWVGLALVTLLGGALRLIGLAHPPDKIFDELYYADEAHDLLRKKVEWNFDDNTPEYVVHPPLGKWMIAIGEQIFGYNSFGWRIMPMVVGTLIIAMTMIIAQRMFRSTILAAAAGLLVSLDGMEFVLSRSALLDIFLLFWILAAFLCLVLDREQRRARWLTALERGVDPSRGGSGGRPKLGVPWWRLAGAVCIGAACGVKWSGMWYVFGFVFLIFIWEVGTRRSAGVTHAWRDTFLDESLWLIAFLGVAVVVYLATWTGWFISDDGYFRHWYAESHHKAHDGPFDALINLWHYHEEAYHFHVTLSQKHQYQSWPWQWLLLGRPVAFYWSTTGACGSASCAAEILLLGTPLLWWSFIPALAGMTWLGIARRDWRPLALGVGVIAGIVPWFWSELDARTMFYFYALPAEPFLVLAVVYVLGAIMGKTRQAEPNSDRRLIGAVIAGVYVLLVAACFAYFYPLYAGTSIPYTDWFAHMWLGSRWV